MTITREVISPQVTGCNAVLKLLLVAHQEDFKLFDVVHEELLEARRQHVFGLLVATITDIGHQHLAFEAPADPVINTSWLPPVALHVTKSMGQCLAFNILKQKYPLQSFRHENIFKNILTDII